MFIRQFGMEPGQDIHGYPGIGCHVETRIGNTVHAHFGISDTFGALEAETDASLLAGEGSMSKHGVGMERSVPTQGSLCRLIQSGQALGPSYAEGSSHVTEARPSIQSLSPLAGNISCFNPIEAPRNENNNFGSGASAARATSSEAIQDVFELPEGFSSVGALGHDKSTCNPCAWNWKPGGCFNGRSCNFCHECKEGEMKRRRKERVAALRRSEKEERQRIARAKAGHGLSSPTLAAEVVAPATPVYYPVDIPATFLLTDQSA